MAFDPAAAQVVCRIQSPRCYSVPSLHFLRGDGVALMTLFRIQNKRGVFWAMVITTAAAIAASLAVTRLVYFLAGVDDPQRVATSLAVSAVVPLVIAPIFAAVGFGQMLSLSRAKSKVERLSHTDSLTQVHNRTYFSSQAGRELSLAARQGYPVSLLLIDLDHFKLVNDRFGHLTGDELLKACARAIGQSLRREDILGRLGGDEFMVLAPYSDGQSASLLAERIRRAVAAARVKVDGREVEATASIGAASMNHRALSLDDLIKLADRAMYQAKTAGRNQVALAD